MDTENEDVLYIIGNGFDLSLGLKTSYNDFFEYIDVKRMRKIIDLLRKDRKNIKEYTVDRLNILLNKLKENDLILENNKYVDAIRDATRKNSLEEIKDKVYSLHKEIFTMLKSKNTFRFVDEYGIFILFLLLINVEKNEWQWVEEQILNYINDIIDICSNNFNGISSYIKDKWDEIELNLEIYSRLVIEKKDLKIVEEEFYKKVNITGENEIVYKSLIKILERKSNEYVYTQLRKESKNEKELEHIEKNYTYYVQNIIYEIEYINFILEIWFTDSKKKIAFNKRNLEILNINENINEKLSLKNQLYMFENYFGNYVRKINDEMKVLISYMKKYEIKDNNFKPEILFERIRKIFFDSGLKYVINFNYTNYLNEYTINNDYGLNIKKIININGSVNSVILETESSKNRIRSPKYIKTGLKLGCEKNLSESMDIEIQKMNKETFIELIKTENIFFSKKQKNECIKKIEIMSNEEFKEFKKSSTIKEVNSRVKEEINKCDKEIMDMFPFTSGLKESKIIFGIDKIQIENIKNFEDKLRTFIKNSRRKNMELEWKQLMNKHKFTKIYFYGHSLADADYTFFEGLFDIVDITNNKIKLIFLYPREYPCQENVKKLIRTYYRNKKGNNNLSDDKIIKKIGEYYIDKLKLEGKLEFREV